MSSLTLVWNSCYGLSPATNLWDAVNVSHKFHCGFFLQRKLLVDISVPIKTSNPTIWRIYVRLNPGKISTKESSVFGDEFLDISVVNNFRNFKLANLERWDKCMYFMPVTYLGEGGVWLKTQLPFVSLQGRVLILYNHNARLTMYLDCLQPVYEINLIKA